MTREDERVTINRHPDYGGPFRCDPEIAALVEALISAGINTVASCSGHGRRPGHITLADGRELVIARDGAEARHIDALFPVDINGESVTAPRKRLLELVTRVAEGAGSLTLLSLSEWHEVRRGLEAIARDLKNEDLRASSERKLHLFIVTIDAITYWVSAYSADDVEAAMRDNNKIDDATLPEDVEPIQISDEQPIPLTGRCPSAIEWANADGRGVIDADFPAAGDEP